MKKVQIEVELDDKYITLKVPGCPDHIAKVGDDAALGSYVLQLVQKAEPKVNGTSKDEGETASPGEENPPYGDREPTFVEAATDLLSTPGVPEGLRTIGKLLESISTPRKEG